MKTAFVDFNHAKEARGLRLVTVANIPSPWSEAAKGIFRVKNIPFVATRLEPGDKAMREWTRARNAPVAMYDDEPGRTGWVEILELAERLAKAPSLVPSAPNDRVRFFGLAHELMSEGGLLWSARIATIDAGFASEGARGFPVPIGQYLGKRYGYAKERVEHAKKRVLEGLGLLREALGTKEYYFGKELTALDIYSAAATNLFALPPDENCAVWPPIRAAFESMRDEFEAPPELVAHRDRMYERHLELPIVL